MLIANGRSGSDINTGNFTFIGVNGNSVIDYLLCDKTLLDCLSEFKIGDRTESSHFPIIASINDNNNNPNNVNVNVPERLRSKYNFDDENLLRFREILSSKLTNGYFNNLASNINDVTKPINNIINDIQSLLKDSSE